MIEHGYEYLLIVLSILSWDDRSWLITVFCQLRVPPLIRAPPSLEEHNAIINGQNRHSFSNNCPIFNPKPPFESWESQLFPQSIRFDHVRAPGALIRQTTVCRIVSQHHINCDSGCTIYTAILTKFDFNSKYKQKCFSRAHFGYSSAPPGIVYLGGSRFM